MNIRLLTFSTLFVFCVNMFSQDTIKFVNKQIVAAKVDEIGTTEVKYHRYDNLNGPVYFAKKDNIAWIKYSNGQVDSFNISQKKPDTEQSFTVYNPKANLNSDKIIVYRNKLLYHQKDLNDKLLLDVISSCPNQQKRNTLLREYLDMKSFQKKQYLYGFGSVGVGAAYLYASLLSNNDAFLLSSLLVAPGVIITGQIVSGINKKKRLKKKIEIANLYNQ